MTEGSKPSEGITYFDTLGAQEKVRYKEKLALIGGKDPYTFSKSEWLQWKGNEHVLPSVSYFDIINYLLFTPSPYTMEDLKAYKGLEAYNQFVCGWVRDQQVYQAGHRYVLTAKVMHSQRMTSKPLNPWLITDKSGRILGAHCDCTAGLGEVCTHVAAVLFAIEATVRIRDSKTVTEKKAYWTVPGGVKTVPYSEVAGIDFTSAKAKKKIFNLSFHVNSSFESPQSKKSKSNPVPFASETDLFDFCSKLQSKGAKAAMCATLPPFSNDYIPRAMQSGLPSSLTTLLNEKCYSMNYHELLGYCANVDVNLTQEQADAIEECTREQAGSKSWFHFRTGRVTASRMKSICHTDPSSPSLSLINSICNPERSRFTSEACEWGCTHESTARDKFVEEMSAIHTNLSVKESGLVINTEFPFIGASPDGIVNCDCCGTNCLEIKCPFCKKDDKLSEVKDNRFCLQNDGEGELKLDPNHFYYYQVQTQLAVCKLEYCFFVVWTNKDIHIETVPFEPSFWAEVMPKAEHVFRCGIMPELVAKFFSRLPGSSLKIVEPTESEMSVGKIKAICYCERDEFGEILTCSNRYCPIRRFHYECLKISKPPRNKKWYCPDCRKLPQFKRSRKQ